MSGDNKCVGAYKADYTPLSARIEELTAAATSSAQERDELSGRLQGLDATLARHERVEQPELERGQPDLGVVDPRAMGIPIDLESAEPDERGLAFHAVDAPE